jgi:hypothetical protein
MEALVWFTCHEVDARLTWKFPHTSLLTEALVTPRLLTDPDSYTSLPLFMLSLPWTYFRILFLAKSFLNLKIRLSNQKLGDPDLFKCPIVPFSLPSGNIFWCNTLVVSILLVLSLCNLPLSSLTSSKV